MNEELKKYLESETKRNEQDIRIREFGMKLTKWLMVVFAIALTVAVIGLVSTLLEWWYILQQPIKHYKYEEDFNHDGRMRRLLE